MRFWLLSCLLCFVIPCPAQDFKVVGYLPTYRFNWLNDIAFERLTHVNIAFANPDVQGNLSCGANIDPAISKAHQHGCQVFISLAGGYLTPEWEAAWDSLALPANRPAFIQKIVAYVAEHQLDGVDLDLEWQYVKDWYSPFVLELKTALNAAGIPLTVALPGSYRYPKITNAALAAFDWVNMMIYDLRGPWDPSNPGQHAPYDWTVQCVQYWKNQGVPGSKLTLGVPFYGYNFGVTPVESFTFRGIVNQDPANAFRDEIDQKFWNGIPTIKAKTALALQEVQGVMIWDLGADCFGLTSQYSLLKAIDETIHPTTNVLDPINTSLKVFPNPVHEWLQMDLTSETITAVEIFDLNGQLQLKSAGNERVIAVSGLAQGMYGLVVSTNAGRFFTRFIKM
jgi:chitinase